jgi:poly(hydroxyalkanoate) depolymerase family esterase
MRPHHLLASFTVLAAGAMAMPACSSPSAEAEPLGSVTSAAGGAIAEVTSFGSNPGALKMWEYVPAGLGTGKPLVLVLHGCGQGATDAAATGWNELADQAGFVVVYPEQQTVNNITKCFSWWGDFASSDDIVRGKGENLSIKQMVDKSIAAHGSDPTRVFVVGFSAGGAEAMVMTSTYPDVFAAGAAIAGIPYDCTTSFSEVSTCIKPGKTKTATEWAALAKAGDPGFTGAWPRMSFWQGSADATVGPQNRTELVKQWTGVHGVDTTTPLADTVDGAAHSSYKNGAGKVVVETYEIPGMDHGVPVVPANSCGTASTYAIDKGICAARHIAAFFGIASASASDAGSDAKPDAKDGGPISSSSSTGGIAGGDAAAASSGGTADPGAADGSHSSTCAAAPPTGRSPFTSSALLGSFLTLTVALARSRSRSRSNKVVPR